MRMRVIVSAALLFAASLPKESKASTYNFTFGGPGVSGTIQLTYGSATDAKYPQAFEVTAISGTFSDLNNGLNIVNAPINSLQPITQDKPEPTNLLAPHDFSRFPVASGLSAQSNGFLTFDNLFYPGGSPPTASDYQVHGGFLDIYGLMFTIGNGRVVDFWSSGDFTGTGTGPISYGVAVATPNIALDYVNGVSITPEPEAWGLMGGGLIGLFFLQRHRRCQANRL